MGGIFVGREYLVRGLSKLHRARKKRCRMAEARRAVQKPLLLGDCVSHFQSLGRRAGSGSANDSAGDVGRW